MKNSKRIFDDFIAPGFVLALLALMLFANTGCTLLGEVSEHAAKNIGKGVVIYCEETIPDVRETFRRQVNEHAAPHSVDVTCESDLQLTTREADEN